MIRRERHFLEMLERGWRPTYHGEYLDLYNKLSAGRIAPTILTTIARRNEHIIILEE